MSRLSSTAYSSGSSFAIGSMKPRTIIAIDEVKEAGLPFIVVFTDPTTGGVTASFAMLGDIHIAEPGATIGFAGARVIQQTIHEALPEGFQRAEYMLEHGMVDMIVHRHELRDRLIRLIRLLRHPVPSAEVVPLQRGEGAVAVVEPAAAATAAEPALTEERAPDA